ncbi:MAG TPA: tetratricopeptide repeat protein, partial [Anaeromyxobacteraceae bacterium]|nr:tetratricopeptide repeat protein [Anaeromyxobacteraceae bacterium]
MATAESGETVAIVDEEFQHHLARGNEQLAAGDPDGARESLRRAAALLPDDPPALAALGQACYRAGLFEEAAVAYGRVVDDAPAEVSARVNLGLPRLKGQHHAEAVKQFSIALDLDPEHRKAMGYLVLALLESGDPRSARPWLERAGSTAVQEVAFTLADGIE